MYTLKILTDLCSTKQKNKDKKWFCKVNFIKVKWLQCFSGENVLIKHKESCLSINGKQSAELEKGIIKFENYLNKYQFLLTFMLILSVT